MPFWRTYYHIIWATRERLPFINAEIEKHLYACIVKKAAALGTYLYAINGIEDHVHLLISIPPKLAVADVVAQLKGASAYHLNHTENLDYTFAWQRGYGVLTLGERQRPQAEAYIAGQKQHHNEQTTNPWLERITEEEKPTTETKIREAPDIYDVGNLPF